MSIQPSWEAQGRQGAGPEEAEGLSGCVWLAVCAQTDEKGRGLSETSPRILLFSGVGLCSSVQGSGSSGALGKGHL